MIRWSGTGPCAGPGLAALLLVLVSGCSDGDSGLTGTAVVQVTDAPFEELTSFELTITDIDLISTSGREVEVFPPAFNPTAELTVDLVRLGGGRLVVAVDRVREGEYIAVRIAFEDARAAGPAGIQTVNPPAGTVRLDLPEPLTVSHNRASAILLDLDGPASTTSTGATTLDFTPTLFQELGQDRLEVVELAGVAGEPGLDRFILAVDDADRTIGEPVFELGQIEVRVQESTIFRVNGSPVSGLPGLRTMARGDVVEVSGRLAPEGIFADFVQVDRAGSPNPIRARGSIVNLSDDAATPEIEFTVLLERLARDEDNQLGSVSVGDSVAARVGTGTSFSRQIGSGPVSSANLLVGQTVELEGALIAGPAVHSAALDLRPVVLTGTLSSIDVAARTASLAVTRVNGSPVADFPGPPALGTVGLDLGSAGALLDGRVPTDLFGLAPGHRVRARGFFGSASEFTVTVLMVDEASDFTGTLVSADPFAGTFLVDIGGAPARVIVDERTGLAMRRLSEPGRLFNLTRGPFLTAMSQAVGSIIIRGRQSGSDLVATRVAFNQN